ncbi:MAG: NADH-quinone oxidoreductase subunit NuoN [Acidithiobacillus sp.]|nr:NADH-quinone oxidoreductase subunit NuoN [Acidithiobacillus sp.]
MQNALFHWSFAIPEIWVLAMACVVLLVDVFVGERQRDVAYVLSIFSLLAAMALTCSQMGQTGFAFFGQFHLDPFTSIASFLVELLSLLVLLYSRKYLLRRALYRGEVFVLLLFALLGALILISGSNLLVLYLGLELLALSQYALVAFQRGNLRATEAGLKYFILGALASALLLYGMSLLYGLTGTLDLHQIAIGLVNVGGANYLLMLAVIFLVAGIAFKFGAAPFHMWLPDAYQGAPTPVTLFMSSVPKIAIFALFLRILVDGGYGSIEIWQQLFVALVVVSLLIGNVVAIAQTNLKRMLAYSTVGNMGFLALGIVAGTQNGLASAFFYAVVYAFMATAAFGLIVYLSREGFEAEEISDLRGLVRTRPWAAFLLLIIMFSLAGVPPTIGFYAKLAVFQALIEAHFVWLAVFGVLMAVVGAFYYLRVLKVALFDPPAEDLAYGADDPLAASVLTVNSLALLILGIVPGALVAFCYHALQGVL